MTPASPPPSPAAVAAFLRGLDKRARLFVAVQSGDPAQGAHALAAVARVFAAEAGQSPLAQWPTQYWRLLLATPALRHPGIDAGSPLPGITRLSPERRAAVLLHLVAGLDDAAAAAALGMTVAAYQDTIRDSLPRNGLGQPDVDVWRAWRAAVQRELERAAEPPPPGKPALAPATRPAPAAPPQATPHATRWLWIGVLLCVLAFVAAFFLHPKGREAVAHWLAAIKREPLPPAATPKARFDPGDPGLHPDRELLAAPREAAIADDLALLAWLANVADPAAPDAILLPESGAAVAIGTAAADGQATATALARRMRQWDALPVPARGARRGHWQAWRALPADERILLRDIGRRFRQLPAREQRALRTRFAGQAPDARVGWWLGPRLGRDWPRIAALFAFVDAGERDALLPLLRAAPPDQIDALARLAQSTAPEERAALRRELLAQPVARRGAWLKARLQR